MANTETVTDLLAKLISFDTTSRNSNLDLISWVEDQLIPLGFDCRRIENSEGDKSNLWARIGPDQPGGLVLSGHSDVVPVDGQPWETDPFDMTEMDGRLFGRTDGCTNGRMDGLMDRGNSVGHKIAIACDQKMTARVGQWIV